MAYNPFGILLIYFSSDRRAGLWITLWINHGFLWITLWVSGCFSGSGVRFSRLEPIFLRACNCETVVNLCALY